MRVPFSISPSTGAPKLGNLTICGVAGASGRAAPFGQTIGLATNV